MTKLHSELVVSIEEKRGAKGGYRAHQVPICLLFPDSDPIIDGILLSIQGN